MYKGDEQRIPELARVFAKKHELDLESELRLVELLRVEIQCVLDKIDEDDESADDYEWKIWLIKYTLFF